MPNARSRDDALSVYRAKRRFNETPEPEGRAGHGNNHLYTIQKHAARRLHYDLRLELDGVLKSWAVTKGPSFDPTERRLAVRTEDHPLDYARFEGRIPEGNYGAGTVLLWDQGEWEPIGDPHEGLAHGKLVFTLHGERLRGRWALIRFHGRQDPKRENWLLIKEKDDLAHADSDVTETATASVASGREMQAIAAAPEAVWQSNREEAAPKPGRTTRKRQRTDEKLPDFVAPELATLVDALPQGDDWLFEMKFDGYRALTAASGEDVRIYTRSGQDWTHRYRSIVRAIAALDLDGVLLDGEIVALDDAGRPDFSALQQALSGAGSGSLSYFVFDLLAERGKSLRNDKLVGRKERLRKMLADAPRGGPIAYTDHVIGDGAEMYRTLCAKGFEGVIAKRADSTYRSGRGKSWLKIKCNQEQEFIIVGWSESKAKRAFASILLAQHLDGKLRYAGRAGSGFDGADLAGLAERFSALAVKKSPLEEKLPASETRGVHWLKPELVAQIAFAEFTADGVVRHARFLGLREDKPARAVRRETAMALETAANGGAGQDGSVGGVRLTHPERVLYAQQGVTKRDVALYLQAAADRMLAHLADRPLSLVRCPEGQGSQCFFQRHVVAGMPDSIRRFQMHNSKGAAEEYIYVNDLRGLLTAAQFGVLEFHIWGVHVDDVEHPDRVVFDLDPDPAVDFATVRQAAADLRDALLALGLTSFPLLSGGKGVHVVVPIVRKHPWPVVKQFSGALAERFAQEMPERYVATMRKAKRTGRIFIDFFRNDRTTSAICPYSPRAREGAPVAWPVTWEELARTNAASGVTIERAMQRLAEPDPWAKYGGTRQHLTAAALRALGVKAGK